MIRRKYHLTGKKLKTKFSYLYLFSGEFSCPMLHSKLSKLSKHISRTNIANKWKYIAYAYAQLSLTHARISHMVTAHYSKPNRTKRSFIFILRFVIPFFSLCCGLFSSSFDATNRWMAFVGRFFFSRVYCRSQTLICNYFYLSTAGQFICKLKEIL